MNDGLEAGRREWTGLAVLALPTLLASLDMSVLFLALPHLAADLDASSTEQLWILDAYGFLLAGFLVTMGTLGDRIGRRRLLMFGATAFGPASLVAAWSTSAEMLIAARAVLGIAGATLMPSTLALIRNMFADARQRGVAIAVWMSCFMVGTAIGPLVGGVLLESFWWGSVFLPAVPVMAAILPVVFGLKELTRGFSWLYVAGFSFAAVFVARQRRLVRLPEFNPRGRVCSRRPAMHVSVAGLCPVPLGCG